MTKPTKEDEMRDDLLVFAEQVLKGITGIEQAHLPDDRIFTPWSTAGTMRRRARKLISKHGRQGEE